MKKLTAIFLVAAVMLIGTGVMTPAKAQSSSGDNADITIIEYSDYQCPACAYFHPIVKKLQEKYGDQINFKLKYYPLNSHQYAALAARAAEASKNQGKFLAMHNLLFQNQSQWSKSGNPTPIFVNYARDIGLDVEEFREDLNAAETQRAVMEEKQSGVRQGVRSTPTFIIEGEQLQQLPRTYAQFDQIVQKYLNNKANG